MSDQKGVYKSTVQTEPETEMENIEEKAENGIEENGEVPQETETLMPEFEKVVIQPTVKDASVNTENPLSNFHDKFLEVQADLARKLHTKHNPQPLKPTREDRVFWAFRFPPHGIVGKGLTLLVLLLLTWGVLVAITGSEALSGGNLFSLLVLFVCSVLAGKGTEMLGLPPLLGMLLVGIFLSSVPGVSIIGDSLNETSSAAIR